MDSTNVSAVKLSLTLVTFSLDLSYPLGKVAYYWLDQNYLAVLKLFLQTVLEQNRRTIDEHGKFICLSNHFESPVMSIYGPGEDVICNQDCKRFTKRVQERTHFHLSNRRFFDNRI